MSDIRILARTRVIGDERDSTWTAYETAFAPLRTRALQRSVMSRAEFDEVMDDERVVKYLAVEKGGVVKGVGTMTTDLTSMPLVSPEYFQARWPDHYAARRCYYIGFVATSPDRQGTELFTRLILLMGGELKRTGGVAVLDVCQRNVDEHQLPHSVARICRAIEPSVELELVDTESYWAYTVPVPRESQDLVLDLRPAEQGAMAGGGTRAAS